jgi:hypothetical protein
MSGVARYRPTLAATPAICRWRVRHQSKNLTSRHLRAVDGKRAPDLPLYSSVALGRRGWPQTQITGETHCQGRSLGQT